MTKSSFGFAFICSTLAWVATVQADEDIKKKIVDAWAKRERETRTINAQIEQLRTLPKGSLSGMHDPPVEDSPVSPPADTTHVLTRALVIDGEKMLHSIAGESWSERVRAFVPEKMISVFDGKRAKSVHIKEEQTNAIHSQGFLHDKPQHPDRGNVNLGPVMRHFRPFSPVHGIFDPQKWTVLSTDAVVNESPCVRILEAGADGVNSREFWIDPSRDMALVRMVGRFGDRVTSQTDVTFKKAPVLGWIPESWAVTSYANGKLSNSSNCHLSDIRLNGDVAGETFALAFPSGTEVSDYALGKMFIVRPEGDYYEITTEDRKNGLTYVELVEKSKQDGGDREEGWMVPPVLARVRSP